MLTLFYVVIVLFTQKRGFEKIPEYFQSTKDIDMYMDIGMPSMESVQIEIEVDVDIDIGIDIAVYVNFDVDTDIEDEI